MIEKKVNVLVTGSGGVTGKAVKEFVINTSIKILSLLSLQTWI